MLQGAPAVGDVFAAMTTPAALLLANAMLVLSTIHRLQAILARIRETERRLRETIAASAPLDGLDVELGLHGRRAGMAQRALLALYGAAATFVGVVLILGLSGLGWSAGGMVAEVGAFAGGGLLLLAAGLLAGETALGVRATDARVGRIVRACARSAAARVRSEPR